MHFTSSAYFGGDSTYYTCFPNVCSGPRARRHLSVGIDTYSSSVVKNPTKNLTHLPWRRDLIRLDTSGAFFVVIIRRPSYEIMARARRQSSLSPLQRVRQVCRYVGFTKPSRLRVNLYRAQSKGFVAKRIISIRCILRNSMLYECVTLNAFCHKSATSALHSMADNAFCAKVFLV